MGKERTETVLFDLDGLLADSELLHWESSARVARRLGHDPPFEEIRKEIGRAASVSWSERIGKWNLPCSLGQVLAWDDEELQKLIRERLKPMPGARKLVEALAEKKIPCAVVSSSPLPQIEAMLGKMGMQEYFSELVSGAQVKNPKPAPDVYLLACKKMRVLPARALALEDTAIGVKAASSAGIPCLAVPTQLTRNQDFSKAFKVLGSLEAFDMDILEEDR